MGQQELMHTYNLLKQSVRTLNGFNILVYRLGFTERKRARTVSALADELSLPHLQELIRNFLIGQHLPNDARDPSIIPVTEFPFYDGKISVFNSASSRFYAPSDISGIHGMRVEHIRSCSNWRKSDSRYDCVFVNANTELDGMRGLEIARVLCFFSFKFRLITYPCAVVRWFDTIGNSPDSDTGMWIVRPAWHHDQSPNISVIHIDAIYRAAHLIPIYGPSFVSRAIRFYHSYDAFGAFYVNKYADHHAFEIAF